MRPAGPCPTVVGQGVGTVADDEQGRFPLGPSALVQATNSVRATRWPAGSLRLILAEVTVRPGSLDTVFVGSPHYGPWVKGWCRS